MAYDEIEQARQLFGSYALTDSDKKQAIMGILSYVHEEDYTPREDFIISLINLFVESNLSKTDFCKKVYNEIKKEKISMDDVDRPLIVTHFESKYVNDTTMSTELKLTWVCSRNKLWSWFVVYRNNNIYVTGDDKNKLYHIIRNGCDLIADNDGLRYNLYLNIFRGDRDLIEENCLDNPQMKKIIDILQKEPEYSSCECFRREKKNIRIGGNRGTD